MAVNEMPPAETPHPYSSVTLGRGRTGGLAEISAAGLSAAVESLEGLWLTPLGHDGEPAGPTTYHVLAKP